MIFEIINALQLCNKTSRLANRLDFDELGIILPDINYETYLKYTAKSRSCAGVFRYIKIIRKL